MIKLTKDMNTQMTALLESAQEAARNLTTLLNKPGMHEGIANVESELESAVGKYNDTLKGYVLDVCRAAKKPMLAALKSGYVNRLMVRRKQDSKTDVWDIKVEIDEDKDPVDIVTLTLDGHAADDRWRKFLPTFNKVIGAAVAKVMQDDVDVTVTNIKQMDERKPDQVGGDYESLFEEANVSEDADVLSVGTINRLMVALTKMLLGDDAPNIGRADARMIVTLGTREGKTRFYRTPNDRTVQRLLQKAIYVRLNGLEYAEQAK